MFKIFIKKKKINIGTNGRNQENKDIWEDGYNKLENKIAKAPFPVLPHVRRTCYVNSTPICVH
jgi:hypothetical protein